MPIVSCFLYLLLLLFSTVNNENRRERWGLVDCQVPRYHYQTVQGYLHSSKKNQKSVTENEFDQER